MTSCWHDPHKGLSPDSKHITWHIAGMTRMKHGLQTANTLQDMLLARPARSMVSRQQTHYMTCCWHDLHEHGLQIANLLHDVIATYVATLNNYACSLSPLAIDNEMLKWSYSLHKTWSITGEPIQVQSHHTMAVYGNWLHPFGWPHLQQISPGAVHQLIDLFV